MAIRDILTLPHKVLERKARKVTDFGPGLQSLIDDLIETMRAAPGNGLAATQVGEVQRVFVAEFGDEEDEETPSKLYVFVNPVLSRHSKETIMAIEGCLSVPDFVGDVERAESVTLKGKNRHGQPMKVKASGWLARIFQHEVDHLNGVLFTDRAEKVYTLEEMEEQFEGFDPTVIG